MYLLIATCIFLPILLIGVFVLIYANSCHTDVPVPEEPGETDYVPITASVPPEATEAPTAVPEETRLLPDVTGLRLDDALYVLYTDNGFTNLSVQFTNDTEAEHPQSNTVVKVVLDPYGEEEEISSEMLASSSAPIRLIVYRKQPGTFKADVSFTFTLPDAGESLVEIACDETNYDNIPYRMILHSRARLSENVEISETVTVYGYNDATRRLYLLVNGEQVSSPQSVTFTK